MPALQRNTRTGKLDAVWRDATGNRVVVSTGETLEERALPRASALEAEARFWDDQGEGVWQRLADSGFSPRYLHTVFVGRAHIIYPRFKALLREAGVKLLPPGKWRDRTRAKGRKSEKRWLFHGNRRTLDELLEHADPSVTRAALRFRLTESKWDVSRALETPLMSRADSGRIGAQISNQPKR
jgi:hypothetical protein